MSSNGWIKIHRSILDWEWYGNPNMLYLFIRLLLLANWKDTKYQGMIIKKGSFVRSIESLSEELKIPYGTLRRRIKKLEKTGEILSKGLGDNGTLFTINKYVDYQEVTNTKVKKGFTEEQEDDQMGGQTGGQHNKNNKEVVTHDARAKENFLSPLREENSLVREDKLPVSKKRDSPSEDWLNLLSVYHPVFDKGLNNTRAKSNTKKYFIKFSKEERVKIISWFKSYSVYLVKDKVWLTSFFKDNSSINEIASFFRTLKAQHEKPNVIVPTENPVFEETEDYVKEFFRRQNENKH
jgi:DNA-binding Lrp family transcriptional regulator